MAKKDKKVKDKKEKRSKSDIITTIILVVLLIIILLGGFAIFIRFNVGGFGNKVMRPILKDVPVIKYILPEEDEEIVEENGKYKSIEEALMDIQKLTLENDKLKKDNADIKNKVEDLTQENTKLKKYKKELEAFEARVKEYENEVVFGESAPDVSEYQKYYEQIDPERAEELYKQVITKIQGDEKAKELANTIAKMDPGAAASALEKLTDNIALVCDVLLDMTEKNRADIMNEMSPEFAAKVTKKIYSQTKTKK